jgi:hypothetical protein
MQTTIEFLGNPAAVSVQGTTVHHARAQLSSQALQNWPEPKSLTELGSLLGTFGY